MVPFIRLFEEVHCPPDHPEILRLQVGCKMFIGIPLFKKKEKIFILNTPAALATFASLLLSYETRQ
jgi:hypothetical protein